MKHNCPKCGKFTNSWGWEAYKAHEDCYVPNSGGTAHPSIVKMRSSKRPIGKAKKAAQMGANM